MQPPKNRLESFPVAAEACSPQRESFFWEHRRGNPRAAADEMVPRTAKRPAGLDRQQRWERGEHYASLSSESLLWYLHKQSRRRVGRKLTVAPQGSARLGRGPG